MPRTRLAVMPSSRQSPASIIRKAVSSPAVTSIVAPWYRHSPELTSSPTTVVAMSGA